MSLARTCERLRYPRTATLVAGAATLMAAFSTGAPSQASSWAEPYPQVVERGSDPVVARGRVWWLTRSDAQTAGPSDFELVSRTLSGGDRRSTSIPLPPPPPGDTGGLPWHAFFDTGAVAIVGRRLIVNMRWEASNLDPKSGGILTNPLVASFDVITGASVTTLRGEDRYVRAYPGTDIAEVTSAAAGTPSESVSLADPALPIPQRAPAAGSGPYTLSFLGTTETVGDALSPRRWRVAEVRRRGTNALVYRVTSRALARAAVPWHSDGEVTIDCGLEG